MLTMTTMADIVERENKRPGGARAWVISYLILEGYARFASPLDRLTFEEAMGEGPGDYLAHGDAVAPVNMVVRTDRRAAKMPIPVVPKLHSTILSLIQAQPERFFMGGWHVDQKPTSFEDDTCEEGWNEVVDEAIENKTDLDPRTCGAAHCRAGWCTVLGGWRGLALEELEGARDAGMLITIASCPDLMVAPDFHASEANAKGQIEDAADLEKLV